METMEYGYYLSYMFVSGVIVGIVALAFFWWGQIE